MCTIVMGQSPEGASYNKDGIGVPLLNGPAEFGARYPTPVQWTTDPARFAEPSDILLCVRGATTGRRNIADRRYCIGRGLAAIRGREQQTDTGFIWFAIELVTGAILNQTSGSTFANLPGDKLARIEIPFPPLPEQRRIVAALRELLGVAVRARAAVEAQIGMARALPAAYLREVFESEQARGWPRRRLGEVSDLRPARTIASDGDVEVTAVTTACLSELGFHPSGVKRARMWSNTVSEATLSAGEVLIARSNTPDLVGRVSMFEGQPEGAVASDLTIRIMPHEPLQSSFLTAYLSYLYMTGYWKALAGGASGSMKKITRRQVAGEEVPVPAPVTQERVVSVLRARLSSASALQERLAMQKDGIGRLPPVLLRRAFRGEL